MTQHDASTSLSAMMNAKPLQAAKFLGILLSIVLGVAGIFRLIDARAIFGTTPFSDGQFLALLLIPLVSLLLVVVVLLETVVSTYRLVRSNASIQEQLDGRVGYLVLRAVEAGIAFIGVMVITAALPPLFAESTPAPAGVGIMLLLGGVGFAILVASFVRSGAEIFVYRGTSDV